MDLAMVKKEQGETLRKYMRRFFDKRATVVDVTDKEVIDLFQDGLYHRRTFEDFGRRRPSSITKLKDIITSWADEEDKANAKYDAIHGKSKQNPGGSNNNNRDQGGRNNNYSGPNRKCKPDNTIAAIQCPAKRQLEEDLWRLQRLAEREVPVAPGGQRHHRAVLPTPASTQGFSRPTASSRQEGQEKS
jgi:transcriptional accessory protein Tex/SPT6